MAFNPNEHLIGLKSKEGVKDYLPVQWRLVWFREQCPQGTIDTDEIVVDEEREVEAEAYVWNADKRRSEKVIKRAKGYARFKAIATDGKGGRSTGTKSENAASFPDYIEKAETGAIGRALAGLGYGTQFAPELDEGEDRIVDAPVERSHSQNNAGQAIPTLPAAQPVASQASPTVNPAHPAPGESIGESLITDQQLSSVKKLCGLLNQLEPMELEKLTYLKAKGLIQNLTAQYRAVQQAQRSGSKAS